MGILGDGGIRGVEGHKESAPKARNKLISFISRHLLISINLLRAFLRVLGGLRGAPFALDYFWAVAMLPPAWWTASTTAPTLRNSGSARPPGAPGP